jgi:serine/threonine-protein kinase HipA
MKKIEVHFCGWGQRWLFGTLADNGSQLLFEYSPAALAQGIEFSPLHLPLRAAAFGDFPAFQLRLPGLLADALPDGWGMLLMDKVFRKNGIDSNRISPLDRLAFIGERAMGAFAFVPAEELERDPADVQLLALAQASQMVLAGKDSAALKQLALLGGSPQGARPKVLVQYDPARDRISTADGTEHPGATDGSTPWLIKFQAQGEHKEVCAIEHLYAQLARASGLEMPRTHYFDLDKKLAGFGIERFDRENHLRVPTHTLAGALQRDFRYPSESYSSLLRLTRLLTRDEREIQKAFERCVFNVIFNNRDDHTKNFSFRMNHAMRWQLAPCYDTSFHDGPGGEHQMDIAGEGRHPAKAHLLKLAASESLNPSFAAGVIERISGVAANFRRWAQDYPIRAVTRNRISQAIEANRGRMV